MSNTLWMGIAIKGNTNRAVGDGPISPTDVTRVFEWSDVPGTTLIFRILGLCFTAGDGMSLTFALKTPVASPVTLLSYSWSVTTHGSFSLESDAFVKPVSGLYTWWLTLQGLGSHACDVRNLYAVIEVT
jgi:hypothetical protein